MLHPRGGMAQSHSHRCAECSPLYPLRQRRGPKCGAPKQDLGTLPQGILEGATRHTSLSLSCTRPVRERPPACAEPRGTSSVASRCCPRASAAQDAKHAHCYCCSPGSFPPQSSASLTFTESNGYMRECSRIPAIAPAVMWVDTEALVGRFS